MSCHSHPLLNRLPYQLLLLSSLAILVLAACSSNPPSVTVEQSRVDYGLLLTTPEEPLLFD